MTNHFPEAFKRFPEKYKHFKSFHDLVDYFKREGGTRAPMTDKQTQALAAEAYNLGMKDVNKQDRKGTWRNIFTGLKTKKGEDTRVPIWRKKDIDYKNGIYRNVETGELLKIRYSKGKNKGRLKKKEEWVLVDRKGKSQKLYPKEKKGKTRKKRS